MRYTAIALDYDGTIAHDGVVPAHVLDGLARLKESGRKLVLVTGRDLDELLGIFPGITIFDRVVAENGALMYRPASAERKALGDPPPRAFVDCLRATGMPLAVGHSIVATVRPHETAVLQAIADLGLEHQVIFNKGAVMILPPGCNKASGLAAALAELGLSPRNVVAGGDGENDHALLDLAEYAVATANAVPTLKDAADYVTRETHGDGILEVVAGLIESDLVTMPPKRRRHALCVGADEQGEPVILPSRRASMLIAGDHARTTPLAMALLERLCRSGYQFCVLDGRGEYLRFKPAVSFGTLDNPPSVEEVLTGLEKPDVSAVVCLAALPAEERGEFIQRLLAPLRELRETAGRPHWILIDEARELMGASNSVDESPASGAENTLYVTDDAAALSPGILASVDGIAVCTDAARTTIESFARALSWGTPSLPSREPTQGEALVWFRRTERPVALVTVARVRSDPQPAPGPQREKSAEVGQVLRRA